MTNTESKKLLNAIAKKAEEMKEHLEQIGWAVDEADGAELDDIPAYCETVEGDLASFMELLPEMQELAAKLG